jgi:hypothetical protein
VDSIEEGRRAVATDSIEVPQWDRAVARRQYSEHPLMAGCSLSQSSRRVDVGRRRLISHHPLSANQGNLSPRPVPVGHVAQNAAFGVTGR